MTHQKSGALVYTETVVYSAPEAFVNDAPYQMAIVIRDDGSRLTCRIAGDRVAIDDRVEFVEMRDGIPYYRKAAGGN